MSTAKPIDSTNTLAEKRILLTNALSQAHSQNYPDIGLGYLASGLMKNGVPKENIVILCKDMGEVSSQAFLNILREGSFDVVGLKAFMGVNQDNNRTLGLVKQALPNALRLVGGPQPSSILGMIFSELPDIHYAFRGECDEVLPRFLKTYFEGDEDAWICVDGLIHCRNGQVQVNPLPIVSDLSTLGFPCWDLLKPEDTVFNPFNGISRNSPISPISLARGCNFKCTFCSTETLNGPGIRYRPMGAVLDELAYLKESHGIREFQIIDPNAAANGKIFEEFCQGLLDRKLDFTWTCPHGLRLERVDEELAKLMKESGCYQVYVGIESGNREILKKMRKGFRPERLREKIVMLDQLGIQVFGFFMMGFPGETREQIQESIRFAKELPLIAGSFNIFTPFPGTRVYDDLCAEGRLSRKNMECMDAVNYENNFSQLSSKELKRLRRKTFYQLYLRPRTLLFFLSFLKSPKHLFFLVRKTVKQYFGFLKTI